MTVSGQLSVRVIPNAKKDEFAGYREGELILRLNAPHRDAFFHVRTMEDHVEIQVARLPYHLSALTQAAGEVALKHAQVVLSGVAEIVAERDRLSKELERVPSVEVFHSDANFILFRTPREGGSLWKQLADAGVLVRDFSQVIPRALRVTVGTGNQNAEFVETLRSVLADA